MYKNVDSYCILMLETLQFNATRTYVDEIFLFYQSWILLFFSSNICDALLRFDTAIRVR